MDQMQTVLFIESLKARKDTLENCIKELEEQEKGLSVFQGFQKGIAFGAKEAYKNELETIEIYLTFFKSCEKDKLQKELH
jgi:hypothetical protein